MKVIYTIPSYFIPYLANGDVEALNVEELGKILKFERQLLQLAKGKSVVYSFGNDSYFASHNDIDSIGSDVTDITVTFI